MGRMGRGSQVAITLKPQMIDQNHATAAKLHLPERRAYRNPGEEIDLLNQEILERGTSNLRRNWCCLACGRHVMRVSDQQSSIPVPDALRSTGILPWPPPLPSLPDADGLHVSDDEPAVAERAI